MTWSVFPLLSENNIKDNALAKNQHFARNYEIDSAESEKIKTKLAKRKAKGGGGIGATESQLLESNPFI